MPEERKEGKLEPIDIRGKYDWFDNGLKLQDEKTGKLIPIYFPGAERFIGKIVRFVWELAEDETVTP